MDARARTCDSRIEVIRDSDGDAFTERHRQHFFTDGQIRARSRAAGFEVVAVTEEYAHRAGGRVHPAGDLDDTGYRVTDEALSWPRSYTTAVSTMRSCKDAFLELTAAQRMPGGKMK